MTKTEFRQRVNEAIDVVSEEALARGFLPHVELRDDDGYVFYAGIADDDDDEDEE